MHFPLTQIPFLLQWYGQTFLASQYCEKSDGQVRVPSNPGGAYRTAPGYLQIIIYDPTRT